MRLAAFGILIGVAALAACASKPQNTPAWYNQQAASVEHTYPNLHDVPRTNTVNTNAAHWAAVQQSVTTAATAMKDNPRDEPVQTNDNDQFINDAHDAIDQSRQAHGPS